MNSLSWKGKYAHGLQISPQIFFNCKHAHFTFTIKRVFPKQKDEVINVTHLDFTWERREELIRKEEREDGKSPTKNAFVGDFLLSKRNRISANL